MYDSALLGCAFLRRRCFCMRYYHFCKVNNTCYKQQTNTSEGTQHTAVAIQEIAICKIICMCVHVCTYVCILYAYFDVYICMYAASIVIENSLISANAWVERFSFSSTHNRFGKNLVDKFNPLKTSFLHPWFGIMS